MKPNIWLSQRAQPPHGFLRLALSFGLLVTIALVGYLAFFFPIHEDEVGWKLMLTRFWRDNGSSVNYMASCAHDFSVAIPKALYPAAILEAWLYQNLLNIHKLRIFGMISVSIWGLLLLLIWNRIQGASKNTSAGFGLLFLGYLPIGLFMNRPEQTLLLSLTLMIALPLFKTKNKWEEHAVFLCFFLAANALFFHHLKGLFFLPLVLAAIWFLKISTSLRVMMGVASVTAAASSYLFYSHKNQCPMDPDFLAWMKSNMLSPSDFIQQPLQSIVACIRNLYRWTAYIHSALFIDNFYEAKMPSWPPLAFLVNAVNKLIKLLIFFWLFRWLLDVAGVLKARQNRWRQDYPLIASLGLFVAVVAMALVQGRKNFYESHLVLPILVIMGVLIGGRGLPVARWFVWLDRVFVRAIFFAVVTSITLLALQLIPATKTAWLQELQFQGSRAGVWISSFGLKEREKRVYTLAQRCGIQDGPQTQHLVIDELTYPYFAKTKEPFFRVVTGTHPEKLAEIMRRANSPGFIGQCQYLPLHYLSQAERIDNLCCISRF
ncbi:hypothetical protein EBR78_04610 [bacterium]|nr:hypothetical protein [bacterium]